MNIMLSLMVGICLVTSPLPMAAKEEGNSGETEWSRVQKVKPGTSIIVSVDGSEPREQVVLRAAESDLTVLSLTAATLPDAATRVLRTLASTHPNDLINPLGAAQFMDRGVRVGRDGVFVADRKVGDLQQLVETSTRREVTQVTIRRKGRGVWGRLGVLGGYFVGSMAGGYVAGFACQATVGRQRCDSGAFLSGGLVGGIAGAVHGYRAANRETEEVLYRAP